MYFNTLFPVLALSFSHTLAATLPQLIYSRSPATDPTTSDSSDLPKYVFARFIVENAGGFTEDDWVGDMTMAENNGIDGFALAIRGDDSEGDLVKSAFSAAGRLSQGFKLYFLFDMGYLPCSEKSDRSLLTNYTSQYRNDTNYFTYPPTDPKPLVTTDGGDACTFGEDSPACGWGLFAQQNDLHFVPGFYSGTDDMKSKGLFDVSHGFLNLMSSWPNATSPSVNIALAAVNVSDSDPHYAPINSSAGNMLEDIYFAFDTDQEYIDLLDGSANSEVPKTYAASVSPWFFTRFDDCESDVSPGGNTTNTTSAVNTLSRREVPEDVADNEYNIFLSDLAFPTRWETLVSQRCNVDFVQLDSWNDFELSTYVGPSPDGATNQWVVGKDHTAWLQIISHYTQAFKTGVFPTLTNDTIVAWARTHPRDADVPDDSSGKPSNYQLLQDFAFVAIFASDPANVSLTSDAIQGNWTTTTIDAGISLLSIPLVIGGTPGVNVTRGGETTATLKADSFSFLDNPMQYDYNVVVAASG